MTRQAGTTATPTSAAEQFVEAKRGAAGEDELLIAVQQATCDQVSYGTLDRVALSEVLRAIGEVAQQLLEGDVGGVQGEQVAEDSRLSGGIFFGWTLDVVRVVHGHYYSRLLLVDLSPL